MAKNADRELRDLLETSQAEVKRLKSLLAAREKPDPSTARLRELEAEVQAARLRVRDLEGENAQLQDDRGTQVLKLQAELKQAREEAAQARDEAKRLQKEVDKAAKAEERRQKSRSQTGKGSLLVRLRGLFEGASKEELERAQREIARLNQHLSRVQPLRPGRR